MKKLLAIIIIVLAFNYSYGDQLAYISLDQAQESKAYLQTKSKVILWCACCDNETPVSINLTKVDYIKVDYKDFYQIVIEGIDETKNMVKKKVDLAYVYAMQNNYYRPVGKILNYDCNPCAQPFIIKEGQQKYEGLYGGKELLKFVIEEGSDNMKDISSHLTDVEAYLSIYTQKNIPEGLFFANVRPKSYSQSYGKLEFLKMKDVSAQSLYKTYFYDYKWYYQNSYDQKTGTAKVHIEISYKPLKTVFSVRLTPEDQNELDYFGYIISPDTIKN